MPRYIDIDKMNRWTEVDQESCSRDNCASRDYDCNECYYNNGGAEDVAPVVHAKWERIENPYLCSDMFTYECSNCREQLCMVPENIALYCPGCGAKMDKV